MVVGRSAAKEGAKAGGCDYSAVGPQDAYHMREVFDEFYGPREDDYRRLITDGLIVLDANILLQLYELPKESREALLSTLERVKDRLWIPFQVGLEFQTRRLTVIARQLGGLESILESSVTAFGKVRSEVEALELQKRGVSIDDANLRAGLSQAESELRKIVEATQDEAAAISLIDPIRDRIDALFLGRVGSPPSSQADVDALGVLAQARYDCAVPPGFKDASKDKDDPKAGLYSRGLKFERKYGDFYLWRQTLDHAKEHSKRVVVFVTSDSKRDWWQIVRDVTVGPLPALVREMKSEGGAELFWMYNLGQFLEQANKHLGANISEAALREVRLSEDQQLFEAAEHGTQYREGLDSFWRSAAYDLDTWAPLVANWYTGRGGNLLYASDSGGIRASLKDEEVQCQMIQWPAAIPPRPSDFDFLLGRVMEAAARLRAQASKAEVIAVVPYASPALQGRLKSSPGLLEGLEYLRQASQLDALHVAGISRGQFVIIASASRADA